MIRFSIPRDIGSPRVPDPEKIVPPTPNLVGNDVKFARFDPATGELINTGTMHRDHIEAEQNAGGNIIEHDRTDAALDRHKVDLVTRKLVEHQRPVDPQKALDDARAAITTALSMTDKYFLTDALADNVTPQEQAQWRAYRQKLRAAYKLDDPDAMLGNIPADPKGVDRLANLRPTKAKA